MNQEKKYSNYVTQQVELLVSKVQGVDNTCIFMESISQADYVKAKELLRVSHENIDALTDLINKSELGD